MYKISFLCIFYKMYEIIYSEILLNKITSPLDQSKMEKSDSTVLVPGKRVATTPQYYSIRFGNQEPSRLQPSLKLDLLDRESIASFKTDSDW